MSSLPKWKVQLLERKRRDEEECKRREKEELERLARMPAWKREIIERRRARLCGGSSQSEAQGEGQAPGGGFAEGQTGPILAQAGTGGSEEAGADWIDPSPGPAACIDEPQEDAVLRENIGPVYQNRFIQQEKQRKETSEPEQPPRTRQAAEPFNHIPGVKTIWAENIIIIESDPGYLESGGETSPWDAEAPSVPVANQDGRVKEARAADVLLIKSSFSQSVEDLNTLNKGQEDDAGEDGESRRGRVSRLLCKFGQGRGPIGRSRPTRSRSTENIIERPSRTGRTPAPDRQALRFPGDRGKDSGSCPRRSSPSPPRTVAAFRSRFESKTPEGEGSADPLPPKPQDQPWDTDGAAQEAPGSGDPQPIPHRSAQSDGSPAGEGPGAGSGQGECEGEADAAAENGRARSQEAPEEDPTLSAECSRARPGHSPNDSCEVRPASPLLEAQAQALAHLRALSKCSFTIVPQHRRASSPEPRGEALSSSRPGDAAGSLLKPQPVSLASSSCAEQASVCVTVAAASAAAASCPAEPAQRDADNGSRDRQADLGAARPPLPDLGQREVPAEEEPGMSRLYNNKPLSAGRARTAAGPEEGRLPAFGVRPAGGLFNRPEKEGAAPVPRAQAAPAPGGCEPLTEQGGPGAEAGGGKGSWAQARSREAVTPGSGGSPTASGKAGRPGNPQRKAGKTITINPRKMAESKTPPSGATAAAANGLGPAAGAEPALEPGKKRYPTAEEIRVIGGYLSPRRSCLAQSGTSRRKLNISFNDCKLESTFEYPSETARLAEFGADEDEEPPQAREPDEEEEEEDVLVPRLGAPGSPAVGMAIRRKPLLVDESCR